MTTIGIVGAGIAGLHLALYLQKHGVPVTVYTDRSPDEVRGGRLPGTVALMGATRDRDTALGTNHWDGPEHGTPAVRVCINGDPPLAFTGALAQSFLFIDMRVYIPRLMEDFAARGGAIVLSPCGAGDVARLAEGHDLMVVATGRAGLTEMFPRVPSLSPYQEPQRRLFGGFFRGISFPSPLLMSFIIVPGQGEVFETQQLTRDGERVTGFLFECIPGGALEPLTHLRYEDDPGAFNAAVLAVVREHMPDAYARTDPATFALMGPLDTVRHGIAKLPGGRFALALGDTHVTHDPIVGQGANAASRAAWLLGELVTGHAHAGGLFDEAFCAQAEQRLWETTADAAVWSNAFLQPPPPHAIELLVAAAQNRAIADAFVTNFNHPDRMWAVLSSPAATAAFIAGSGAS
jgi:hypothetical protein